MGEATEAIDSSNKGFQLLKKHGWTEGTGLGVKQQGRLEPVEAHMKSDKRGLGAERKKKKKTQQLPDNSLSKEKSDDEESQSRKKAKVLSKKMRKMLEHEKLLQEKEFERAFRREFWPDNV